MSLDNLSCDCDHGATDQEKYEKIGQMIDVYKDQEGSLIMVLHAAQEIYGYLPVELQKFISVGMDVPFSVVHGVVGFYSFFSTVEQGKNPIRVCMGTACYVRGAEKLVTALEEQLNVKVGEVTPDKKFSLDVARCIGACGLAPAVMIGDDVHQKVAPGNLDSILTQY